MARPAHPKSHDARLRDILEKALHEERLIPCPDFATTKLIRSRLREIIRAHKEWRTGEHMKYKSIRFKILETHLILPVRPSYDADDSRFPFTLCLDSRDPMDEILDLAAGSTSTPLTRAPQNASLPAGLEDEDDEEDGFERLTSIYNRKENYPAHASQKPDEEDNSHS